MRFAPFFLVAYYSLFFFLLALGCVGFCSLYAIHIPWFSSSRCENKVHRTWVNTYVRTYPAVSAPLNKIVPQSVSEGLIRVW
jgi:hypothetical protein